jgi:hypothetical protein
MSNDFIAKTASETLVSYGTAYHMFSDKKTIKSLYGKHGFILRPK